MRFKVVWSGLEQFEWLLSNVNNRYQLQKLRLRVVAENLNIFTQNCSLQQKKEKKKKVVRASEHTQSLTPGPTRSANRKLFVTSFIIFVFLSPSQENAMGSIPLSRSSYRFQHPNPFRSLESLPLLSVTRLRVLQSGSPSSFKVAIHIHDDWFVWFVRSWIK